MIDRDVRMEALSILLGAPVIQGGQPPDKTTRDCLSVDHFITAVIQNGQRETSNDWLETGDSFCGSNLSPLGKEFFIDEQEFFDPAYDFDFTSLSETAKCVRGGEPYERPCGWYRMALKVKNKYPDGNSWLGAHGWRNESTPGEWPVSYHGTSIDGAKNIVQGHYKAGGGTAYGRGIYSTPTMQFAESYSKTFKSKKTGKNYKVVMQNRINTKERKICQEDDYWLVPVPEGTSAKDERKIVERSIRPYGILIKEVKPTLVPPLAAHSFLTPFSLHYNRKVTRSDFLDDIKTCFLNIQGLFVDEDKSFHSVDDFDFASLSETTKCVRGGEPYELQGSWNRMALKVKNNHQDRYNWLDAHGWRNKSTPGEWPVSYHGTSIDGAKNIVQGHYKAGGGDLFGGGIYSNPNIHLAESYSKTFKSKKTGKSYEVVMQHRINTKERRTCEDKDYWTVPVPEGTSAEDERKIVERSFGPYGILIKEVKPTLVPPLVTMVKSTTASTTRQTLATITMPVAKTVTYAMRCSHAASSHTLAPTTAQVVPKCTTVLSTRSTPTLDAAPAA